MKQRGEKELAADFRAEMRNGLSVREYLVGLKAIDKDIQGEKDLSARRALRLAFALEEDLGLPFEAEVLPRVSLKKSKEEPKSPLVELYMTVHP